MRTSKAIRLAGLLAVAAVCFANMGCHIANHTAGRPGVENGDGMEGSVVATKEGTGDSRVGSGEGQVGTDAPARNPEKDPALAQRP